MAARSLIPELDNHLRLFIGLSVFTVFISDKQRQTYPRDGDRNHYERNRGHRHAHPLPRGVVESAGRRIAPTTDDGVNKTFGLIAFLSIDRREQHLASRVADPVLDRPTQYYYCLLYTSPSPRDKRQSRMPSSA